jgi:hypothetical protein
VTEKTMSVSDFSHTILPGVKKTVFRMGVAGSYGIDSADIRWAADHGSTTGSGVEVSVRSRTASGKLSRVIAKTM